MNDLADIASFIKADNAERAESFVNEIQARCERLGFMPNAYPLVPRHEASGIRRCTFRDYLIFYRVGPEQVDVLHVLHGARDVDPLLFPED
jgi:toxin ParE1/3/4